MYKKRLMDAIEARPDYYYGQLLLADDFLAEQDYHAEARLRHNKKLHGWGVVSGLEVWPGADRSVTINPGFALDESGRDVVVDRAESLDLSEFGPNALVKLGLAREEEPLGQDPSDQDRKRRKCYAVLTASRATETSSALVLARVQLDEQGKVRGEAIDYSGRKYARAVLAPGSVTATELDPELRTGWLRMPFRPIPLTDIPAGESALPEPFRVGVTRAISPAHKEAGEEDPGAGGTMAIAIPPNVKQVTRFRIAGEENDRQILVRLFLGGWDPQKNEHVRTCLLEAKIDSAPFMRTFDIAATTIDPEYHHLSLWLRGTGRTSISLIAVEVAF